MHDPGLAAQRPGLTPADLRPAVQTLPRHARRLIIFPRRWVAIRSGGKDGDACGEFLLRRAGFRRHGHELGIGDFAVVVEIAHDVVERTPAVFVWRGDAPGHVDLLHHGVVEFPIRAHQHLIARACEAMIGIEVSLQHKPGRIRQDHPTFASPQDELSLSQRLQEQKVRPFACIHSHRLGY